MRQSQTQITNIQLTTRRTAKMVIKTKYDIGQKVYYKTVNQNLRFEICETCGCKKPKINNTIVIESAYISGISIDVYTQGRNETSKIMYSITHQHILNEKELYETEKDALNSKSTFTVEH
jgi:hypothetical protein